MFIFSWKFFRKQLGLFGDLLISPSFPTLTGCRNSTTMMDQTTSATLKSWIFPGNQDSERCRHEIQEFIPKNSPKIRNATWFLEFPQFCTPLNGEYLYRFFRPGIRYPTHLYRWNLCKLIYIIMYILYIYIGNTSAKPEIIVFKIFLADQPGTYDYQMLGSWLFPQMEAIFALIIQSYCSLLMEKIGLTSWYGTYVIITGFLTSQVVQDFHQPYHPPPPEHRPRCNDANEQNGTKQDGLAGPLGSRPHFLFIQGWSQLKEVNSTSGGLGPRPNLKTHQDFNCCL